MVHEDYPCLHGFPRGIFNHDHMTPSEMVELVGNGMLAPALVCVLLPMLKALGIYKEKK